MPDEIEKEFRKTAMEVFGYKRGSLSIAAGEALKEWVTRMKSVYKMTELEVIEDSVEAIWGMLKASKSGVELQHEASKIRARHVFD